LSYLSAFHAMNISLKRYFTLYALPVLVTTIITSVILIYLFPSAFSEGLGRILALSIPFYGLLAVLVYPIAVRERIKTEINQNMHYFITHLGILATSDLDRKKMVEHLARRKEFGVLAEEMRKIYVLMDKWNLSLAEASRIVSRKCPSSVLSDFLDRFAHAVDAGEDLEEFLKNEQRVVMDQYSVMYQGALYDVENIKDVFISLTISMIFITCFALILPVISGQDVMFLMSLTILFFVLIELMMFYYMRVRVPKDPLWHSLKGFSTDLERKYNKYLLISLVGCILMFALVIFIVMWEPRVLEGARPGLLIAAGISPMYIVGRVMRNEEEFIRRREDNYGAFIRSLGGATAARGGIIESALESLQTHDFGPLTSNIRALYRRLRVRVNKELAWKFFSAETGSNLIDRFTDMFVEGITVGGKADVIGDIIGGNVTRIIGLRRQRKQSASTFTGTLYGLMVGISFSLFVTFQIIDLINSMFMKMGEASEIVLQLFPIHYSSFQYAPMVLIVIVIIHSLISSLMIKTVDGGHTANIYTHFITLMWIGMITANLTEFFISPLLTV